MLILDDFGYLRDALIRCESHLVNTLQNPDNLLRSVRLALSVLDNSHVTCDELRNVIGHENWVIKKTGRLSTHEKCRCPDAVAITPKRFREYERLAIERRVPE